MLVHTKAFHSAAEQHIVSLGRPDYAGLVYWQHPVAAARGFLGHLGPFLLGPDVPPKEAGEMSAGLHPHPHPSPLPSRERGYV